ncbi:hypothetical protein DSM100688_0463 [Bifidobacterium ramosum]|uniref:DUF881 domain-containing protein n=1 Tax=Bifidobacterium ramosum TaxID=1798158 RepID=A0A6L4X488_9BIFI|nr:DUF881 domain-containing protein [Bifidobacterium ramosum]KAB8289383.1 hypothetical protein DSM100688_0463 [Bifidobacterium ramosum]NEG71081.1 DUF881 domain-containing protein [Bifidobacterium ramosum]
MPEEFDQRPATFPVPDENASVRRRAAFSQSFGGLTSHHVVPASAAQSSRRRRRKAHDDSLQLIDDLTNRPMDPLFSDSRLTQRPTSAIELWFTRVVVFVICVAVGFFGCLFIQRLHTDPRKAVRQNWASELEELNTQVDKLNTEVSALQGQVTAQSKKIGSTAQNDTLMQDEMVNGVTRVTGEGITLTLANPIAADDSANGTYHRDNTSDQIRLVSDADLQMFVSLLWQSGAEAISINGYRLGVQTSIRTAGQTIMVGVNPVQSPYRIEAIGNRNELADAVGSKRQPALYASFAESGIYPQVSKSKSITLEAAASGNLSYATTGEDE